MGLGIYSMRITNVLAVAKHRCQRAFFPHLHAVDVLRLPTQLRQHAPENSKRRRGLLVEFPERRARQLL